MTRRGLASALLPATVAAVLGAVVLSSAGGSAAAVESPRDAVAPFRAASLNLAAARVPLLRRGSGEQRAPRRAAACDAASGVTCSDVVVPLDRTGRVPGTITLHVESLPAEGAERGVMMLVAGGPGQGSATVFNLSDKDSADLYHALFPGYRIVAFDNRGTGKSGLLVCSALQKSTTFVGQEELAAGCAASIGPNRDFYSTHDHVDDTEAVRVALGVDKIALWGTSYGTKLALAYALAYPTHVERLLLDSVLPTEYPEPLEANVLHDMPLALSSYCGAGACRAATPNFAGDVAAVANTLARTPARGAVRLANGSVRNERMDGLDMLALVVDSDLNPGLAAMLPAATHAARAGRMGALLRLHYLDIGGSTYSAEELSVGLNAATSCADGHFPWDPAAPLADRPAKLTAAISSLPAGALGPFGTVGDSARHGRLLPQVAERCGGDPAARRGAAPRCPGACPQRWLRHAHADLERGGGDPKLPPRQAARRAGSRSQRRRRRQLVLRDPRRPLVGDRRQRPSHLPASVLPRRFRPARIHP